MDVPTGGEVAWVKYNVPGRQPWHQGLILASDPSLNELVAIVTSDGDLYLEELKPTGDIRAVAWEMLPGVLPAELRGVELHRFGALGCGG